MEKKPKLKTYNVTEYLLENFWLPEMNCRSADFE